MKKLLALLLVFLMLVATFTGCSDKGNTSSEPNDDVTADVSSEPEEDVSSEPEEDVSSEPEEEPSSAPQYNYEEPEEEPEAEPEDEVIEANPLSPAQQRYENILEGLDEQYNKDALPFEGELGRLAKAIKKAEAGETVKIVFYGDGANTAHNTEHSGVEAYTPYADIFKEWFEGAIGPCEVYKAGSYNLTSKLACLRVEHDVLRFEPDIVLLDFAVQDAINAAATSNAYAYDNLIRRLLQSKTSPAVVSMILTAADPTSYSKNSSNPDAYVSASKQHKELAEYYNLPVIDFETAFWEALGSLVDVTTQIERPVLAFKDLTLDNMIYKQKTHDMVCGAVINLMRVVQAKGAKANANFKYPTEGFFGSDEYMNTSFVSVTQIVEGKAKGYAFDLDFVNGTEEDLFGYEYFKNDVQDGNSNSIMTKKHYIKENDATAADEINPHYLKITVPEVKEDTYLMFVTTNKVNSKQMAADHPITKYYPIGALCTDASGNKTHSSNFVKLSASELGKFTEAPNCGKSSALLIPKGTTQIELRIYDRNGTVYFLGIANKK